MNPEDSSPQAAQTTPSQPKYQFVPPLYCQAGDGILWVKQGFTLFKLAPFEWILTVILGLVIALAMAAIPFIGQLASSLTTYVWVAGLMLGCQAAYEGRRFEVRYLFAGFKQQLLPLMSLSAVMALSSGLILTLSLDEYQLAALTSGIETLPPGSSLHDMLLGISIVLLLSIPLMMAAIFAPALIVLHNVNVLQAMQLSFLGCMKNALPFLLYGLVFVGLFIIVGMTMGLALLIVAPLMYTSIYAAYRGIYLIEPAKQTPENLSED